MLESLEQANIKRMAVERPEKPGEIFFDPRKEIDEQYLAKVRAAIPNYIAKGEESVALNIVQNLRELGFDIKNEVDFSPADLREIIERIFTTIPFHDAIKLQLNILKLYSDWRPQIPQVEPNRSRVQEIAKAYRKSKNWSDFAELVAYSNEFTPGMVPVTPEDIKGIEGELMRFIRERTSFTVPHLAAHLKALDPNFDISKFDIDWNRIESDLKIFKSDYSMYMKMAKATYDLNTKTELETKQEPLPEIKQF